MGGADVSSDGRSSDMLPVKHTHTLQRLLFLSYLSSAHNVAHVQKYLDTQTEASCDITEHVILKPKALKGSRRSVPPKGGPRALCTIGLKTISNIYSFNDSTCTRRAHIIHHPRQLLMLRLLGHNVYVG